MRTKFLTLALVILTTITSAFATNKEGVNARAIESFKKEFAAASDVKWESNKTFSKATFSLNNQVMFAYYTPDGEFLALSRNLKTAQLPISLATDLKKSYDKFWISDVFEVASPGETSYYATVQNADQSITLKSNGLGGWTVYKKEKKNEL